MSDVVRIVEVGPRDGLQNEPHTISLEQKIAFIDALSVTGLQHIEAASFVSAKTVPQMANSDKVMAGIKRRKAVTYSALVPNVPGYIRARTAHADEIAVFASASESFSQKNINCSIAESLERFVPVMESAKTDNIPMRAYISCIARC
ncbi:MAG: hydroxymethylglutaryl-CoA lyase, partial [Hyphomicrobiales bacterium]